HLLFPSVDATVESTVSIQGKVSLLSVHSELNRNHLYNAQEGTLLFHFWKPQVSAMSAVNTV
ncbi:hypothetical protein ACQP3F_34965, partial [Escherichia coli]